MAVKLCFVLLGCFLMVNGIYAQDDDGMDAMSGSGEKKPCCDEVKIPPPPCCDKKPPILQMLKICKCTPNDPRCKCWWLWYRYCFGCHPHPLCKCLDCCEWWKH